MIILGGGLGGLAAAHYLLKHGHKKIRIIESAEAVGGWIRSVKDPKTGLIFEKGPRTVRMGGSPVGFNTLSLVEDIGIGSKVIPILKTHPSAKKRLIYVNNNLCLLPTSVGALFKKTPPFSKPLILFAFKDILTPKKNLTDDSMYNFAERRFGREIADYLISPLICGICAGDAKEISVKFLMPSLFEFEQRYGSVVSGIFRSLFRKKSAKQILEGLPGKAQKEKWSVFGLEGGMQELPIALEKNVVINGAELVLNSPASEIHFKRNYVTVKIGNEEVEGKHLISDVPARNLAILVQKEHPELAKMLQKIPYVTVCVVNLAYKGNVLKQEGFGFLVPPSQNIPILGVIFDTCNFPQGDWTVLTVMMGGHWFQKYFGQNSTNEYFLECVQNHMKSILGIEVPPDSYHISVLKDCISQQVVGHQENVKNIFSYVNEKKLPLSLVGSSYKGAGINDVIMNSKIEIEKIMTN